MRYLELPGVGEEDNGEFIGTEFKLFKMKKVLKMVIMVA